MLSRSRAVGAVVLLLSSFLACAKPAKINSDPPKVQLFDSGGTKALRVTVLDQKGRPMDGPKLKFSSSNPEVAEVDNAGKVAAYMSGEAVITVSSGTVSARVPVVVRIASSLELKFMDKAQETAGIQGPVNSHAPLLVSGMDDLGKPADLSAATFASSNSKAASVDQHGVLTLLSSGTTEVSVSMGKTKATLQVPVTILVPMAIKLENPALSVKVGESLPLAYTVISDAGTALAIVPAFASSDAGVAKVDEKGVVTGISRGSVTISISIGGAANNVAVTVR